MSNNDREAPVTWHMPKPGRDIGLTLKAAAAVALSIVALIPLMQVENLVLERWMRQQAVIDEISEVWGGAQQFAGPYLEIPITRRTRNAGIGDGTQDGHIVVLPATLGMSVDIQPELRHRGIFEAIVYVAAVTIEGHFDAIDGTIFPADLETADWDNARLRLDVSDARSIRGTVETLWHGSPVELQRIAGPTTLPDMADGLATKVSLRHAGTTGEGGDFHIRFVVAGSGQVEIIPSAGSTHATVRSPWDAPSFNGSFLPATSEIDGDGFTAQWAVSGYARGFPLAWLGRDTVRYDDGIRRSAFGVELIEEVGLYRKTERAVKYGLLFFAATFLTFLVLEVSSGIKLHVLHYGLVGAALCVFYVLLLSLAEVIGFPAAFAVSALAVVAQTGVFTWSVVRRPGAALMFAAVLASVYAYLYVLLDLEDMALLGGALGLFLLLSVAMFALRGIGGSDGLPGPENLPQEAAT